MDLFANPLENEDENDTYFHENSRDLYFDIDDTESLFSQCEKNSFGRGREKAHPLGVQASKNFLLPKGM